MCLAWLVCRDERLAFRGRMRESFPRAGCDMCPPKLCGAERASPMESRERLGWTPHKEMPQSVRKNVIKAGSFRQWRFGLLSSESSHRAKALAFISRSISA